MLRRKGIGIGLMLSLLASASPAFAQRDASVTPDLEKKILELPASAYLLPGNEDLPRDANLAEASFFAWRQFLALSLKADLRVGHRGEADASRQLGQKGETLVWQTYAHKVELRPNGPLTVPWSQLGRPNYGVNAYREPVFQGERGARWDLWNNLDEDNEINSSNLYANYQHQASPKELILYQAKVNKDEYEYFRVNFGLNQHLSCSPEETGSDCPSFLIRARRQVLQSIKGSSHSYYPGAPTASPADATCNCGIAEEAICLPCGGYEPTSSTYPEGAIEVKSAWRKLPSATSPEGHGYYTSEAIYYERDAATGDLVYKNGTFALIGIHIIRKLANFPDFVFTTFEHRDLLDGGYEFKRLHRGNYGLEQANAASPIYRRYPLPRTVVTLNDLVHDLLEGTVWQNYHLTGLQTSVVDCALPSSASHMGPHAGDACRTAQDQDPGRCLDLQPFYFMANLVIESDPVINSFSGPGFGSNPFNDCSNTVYAGMTFNQGGCKGCHGVAQTSKGTDFSFLLDDFEKPVEAPDTLYYRRRLDGFQGPFLDRFIRSEPHITRHFVFSLDQCRSLCEDGCKAFSYYPGYCFISNTLPLYNNHNFQGTPGLHFTAYVRDGVSVASGHSQSRRIDLESASAQGALVLAGTQWTGESRESIEISHGKALGSCADLCRGKPWCRAFSVCREASGGELCQLFDAEPETSVRRQDCTSGLLPEPPEASILDFQRSSVAEAPRSE